LYTAFLGLLWLNNLSPAYTKKDFKICDVLLFVAIRGRFVEQTEYKEPSAGFHGTTTCDLICCNSWDKIDHARKALLKGKTQSS
jgi:hypothetical protein